MDTTAMILVAILPQLLLVAAKAYAAA